MRTKRMSGKVLVAVLVSRILALGLHEAAGGEILKKGALEAELTDGILVNVKVNDTVVLKEFGKAYVNGRGVTATDKPLQSYVSKTEETTEKGDRFFVSDGIMRIPGEKFLGEFGRVWSVRKDGSFELTFHPTYFNQKWNTPDRERPLHVDVVAVVDSSVWKQSSLEVDGKMIPVSGVTSYPTNVTKILLPASADASLAVIPLNMPDSFAVTEKGETVEFLFSDQNAMTTWYVLTDCPSCRLSLKVE